MAVVKMLQNSVQLDGDNAIEESAEMEQIGYYWSRDKDSLSRFSKILLTKLLKDSQYKLVRLNFDKPLEEQGPFIVIIHKIIDLIVKGNLGNERAERYHQLFKEYIENHPETIIIDPLHSIEPLISRLDQYNKLDEYVQINNLENIFIPKYVELISHDKKENLEALNKKDIEFPIICKPLIAQGTAKAHKLTIILTPSGLAGLKPPCIAQQFINHNAVLYKMYIVGDTYNIIEKPSIKNVSSGDYPNINFTSKVCKYSASSALTKNDSTETIEKNFGISKRQTKTIFNKIPSALGLDLLGIDIIVERRTRRHAIIDINLFPGYAEVKDLIPRFHDLIISKIPISSTTMQSTSSTSSEAGSLPAVQLTLINLEDEWDYDDYDDEDDEFDAVSSNSL